MLKLIDLQPILEHIAEKLDADRQALRRILDAREIDDLRNFDEQDRLLREVQAGVRAINILEGSVDLDDDRAGARGAVLPTVARLAAE